MSKLKVLDLFSGIGGFSLGLERTGGFETVAFCEIDPFCQKVLKNHWPERKIYHDIATAEFEEPVDLVTGGFPCQDVSYAGEGAGLAGQRSGLFWEILRTVRMVGFPKLLLENVAALLNRGMAEVLGALSEIGYDTEWHCIPAASVGAPHIRDRVWIMADTRGFKFCNSDILLRNGNKAKEWRQDAKKWGSDWFFPQMGTASFERLGIERQEGNCEPYVLRVVDGVPEQLERNKSLGNSVVPQIPEIIGHAILASMKE